MLESILPTIGLFALPVLGGIAAELLRIVGGKLREDFNPAIAQLRPYYSVIDAALAVAPPELRHRIEKNPVAYFATELLSEDDFADDEVNAAAAWASRRFDFSVYEKFKIEKASPETRALASRLVDRLSDRLLA